MNTRERILEFIKEYKEEYENSPTYREIMEGVGLASTSTVSRHLIALQKEGLIERDRFLPRSIRIVRGKT